MGLMIEFKDNLSEATSVEMNGDYITLEKKTDKGNLLITIVQRMEKGARLQHSLIRGGRSFDGGTISSENADWQELTQLAVGRYRELKKAKRKKN